MVGDTVVGLGNNQLLLIRGLRSRRTGEFFFILFESVVYPIPTLELDNDCAKRYSSTHASISVVSALLFHYFTREEDD